MIAAIQRLVRPIILQVDFRDALWAISRKHAWALLLVAVFCGLLAQYLVGAGHWLPIALTVFTPVVYANLPARLAGALASILTIQALVSVGLIMLLFYAGMPYVAREAAGIIWGLWCMAATLILGLRYLRTPKHEFRQ